MSLQVLVNKSQNGQILNSLSRWGSLAAGCSSLFTTCRNWRICSNLLRLKHVPKNRVSYTVSQPVVSHLWLDHHSHGDQQSNENIHLCCWKLCPQCKVWMGRQMSLSHFQPLASIPVGFFHQQVDETVRHKQLELGEWCVPSRLHFVARCPWNNRHFLLGNENKEVFLVLKNRQGAKGSIYHSHIQVGILTVTWRKKEKNTVGQQLRVYS